MRKALIVSYHFPPRPTIGSVRIAGLAKYLPLYGWEPVILTPEYGTSSEDECRVVRTGYKDLAGELKTGAGLAGDRGLQEQLGKPRAKGLMARTLVESIVSIGKSIVFYPDPEKGWSPYGVDAGRRLLLSGRIDAIISSSKPETSHIIAKCLKREFGIPWIADFRDLWTQNHHYSHGPVRHLYERKLEIATIGQADALVTVSSPLADLLSQLHAGKPVRVIANGFDPRIIAPRETPVTESFTITYTGSLYEGKRDPEVLLRAISTLIGEGVMDPKRVHVRFYGAYNHHLEYLINCTGLSAIVDQCGTVDRDTSLARQRESQILLLLNWNHPAEEGVYTGKVFEYLAARRPILAVGGPAGVVGELLAETCAGTHVGSLDDCVKVLRRYWLEYCTSGRVTYRGSDECVDKYSQTVMAHSFASLLDEVTL